MASTVLDLFKALVESLDAAGGYLQSYKEHEGLQSEHPSGEEENLQERLVHKSRSFSHRLSTLHWTRILSLVRQHRVLSFSSVMRRSENTKKQKAPPPKENNRKGKKLNLEEQYNKLWTVWNVKVCRELCRHKTVAVRYAALCLLEETVVFADYLQLKAALNPSHGDSGSALAWLSTLESLLMNKAESGVIQAKASRIVGVLAQCVSYHEDLRSASSKQFIKCFKAMINAATIESQECAGGILAGVYCCMHSLGNMLVSMGERISQAANGLLLHTDSAVRKAAGVILSSIHAIGRSEEHCNNLWTGSAVSLLEETHTLLDLALCLVYEEEQMLQDRKAVHRGFMVYQETRASVMRCCAVSGVSASVISFRHRTVMSVDNEQARYCDDDGHINKRHKRQAREDPRGKKQGRGSGTIGIGKLGIGSHGVDLDRISDYSIRLCSALFCLNRLVRPDPEALSSLAAHTGGLVDSEWALPPMVGEKNTVRRNVPIEALLSLVARILSVDHYRVRTSSKSEPDEAVLNRRELEALLPELHQGAYELLASIIECCGGQLLPHFQVVSQMVLKGALSREARCNRGVWNAVCCCVEAAYSSGSLSTALWRSLSPKLVPALLSVVSLDSLVSFPSTSTEDKVHSHEDSGAAASFPGKEAKLGGSKKRRRVPSQDVRTLLGERKEAESSLSSSPSSYEVLDSLGVAWRAVSSVTESVEQKVRSLRALETVLRHTGSLIPGDQRAIVDRTLVGLHYGCVAADRCTTGSFFLAAGGSLSSVSSSFSGSSTSHTMGGSSPFAPPPQVVSSARSARTLVAVARDERFREAVYSCMLASLLAPVGSAPPLLPFAADAFAHRAKSDASLRVRAVCQRGEAVCEVLLHPRRTLAMLSSNTGSTASGGRSGARDDRTRLPGTAGGPVFRLYLSDCIEAVHNSNFPAAGPPVHQQNCVVGGGSDTTEHNKDTSDAGKAREEPLVDRQLHESTEDLKETGSGGSHISTKGRESDPEKTQELRHNKKTIFGSGAAAMTMNSAPLPGPHREKENRGEESEDAGGVAQLREAQKETPEKHEQAQKQKVSLSLKPLASSSDVVIEDSSSSDDKEEEESIPDIVDKDPDSEDQEDEEEAES